MEKYIAHRAEHEGFCGKGMEDRSIVCEFEGEHLVGVFDGHSDLEGVGGERVSEYLSDNFAKVFFETRYRMCGALDLAKTTQLFINVFGILQRQIIDRKISIGNTNDKPSRSFSAGSTASVLFIDRNDNHFISYIGDSPIFGVTDTGITDLVGKYKYHKVGNIFINEEEWKRLSDIFGKDELYHEVAGNSYFCGLALTRSFGDTEAKSITHIPAVREIEPRYNKYLLTSDGVTDTFSESDLHGIISEKLDFCDGVKEIVNRYGEKVSHAMSEETDLDNVYFDNATAVGIEKI